MKILAPELLWRDGEFHSDLHLEISDDGTIARVAAAVDTPADAEVETLPRRALLPGMVNAHSHAFQRGLRGKAESFGAGSGTFWSWRDEMYRLANAIDRPGFERLTELAFTEMLRAGITTVGEFHYLHHEGATNDYRLDDALISAAGRTGIRLVALDVCYLEGDVDQPLAPEQRRFGSVSVEAFVDSALELGSKLTPKDSLGLVAHSLRAVPVDALEKLHRAAREHGFVFHLHLEEQPREIEAVRAHYGQTPMGLVVDRLDLGPELTAVHCTHTAPDELERFVATGANVCVCPLTEANLADGIPPAPLATVPAVCLGTDSNLRIDMNEEMRLLEYAQRLRGRRRGVFTNEAGEVAARLFSIATEGGARSLGIRAGALEPGFVADVFTLDLTDPSLARATPSELMTAFVFGAGSGAIHDVAVAGRWLG